jgi:serine/threonine-protein kinase
MVTQNLGRYELLSELGHGAMGTVYKANDPLIDRTVAIKTINFRLSEKEYAGFRERFFREAKSAGRLNHPNIVTIYDAGEWDHTAYIAMELLEGRDLRDIISSGESLSLDRIADIIAQAADGLAYAHRHGIVHRDVKPANIMVLHNGQVKITDFGIAKIPAGEQTQTGTILGSPKYMSPEQILGQPVDGRSDIFALGAVLYELLNREPAFGGENVSTLMYRILHEPPRPLETRRPDIPAAFSYILDRALAKKAEDRYQSAEEMAQDIRNYARLEPPPDWKPCPVVLPNDTPLDITVPIGHGDQDTTLLTLSGFEPRMETTIPLPATRKKTPVKAAPRRLSYLALAGAAAIAAGIWLMSGNRPETRPTPAGSSPTAVFAPPALPAPTDEAPPGEKSESSRKVADAVPLEGRPAPKPAGQPADSPRPRAAGAAPTAILAFAITPWGEVYVDGEKKGVSPPLSRLKVPPGRHQVEIRNTTFPPYTVQVEARAETSVKIKHRFR